MKEDVRAMVKEGSVGGQTSSTPSSMFELWVEMSHTTCNDKCVVKGLSIKVIFWGGV